MDKAGTTSLYEYLNKIPGVYMSPIKEPCFFAPVSKSMRKNSLKVKNEKDYLDLFKNVKNESAIGEASTVYWRDPKAPDLIHDKIPSAKIIISLRDPIDRIFSDYLLKLRSHVVKTTFNEYIKNRLDPNNEDMKKPASYYENLKRYLDTFDRNQIKIIIFEEWIKKPKETVQEILSFLGINYAINEFDNKVYNPTLTGNSRGRVLEYIMKSNVARKIAYNLIPIKSRDSIINNFFLLGKEKPKPPMKKQDKELLINNYQEDIRKLEILLGRKLSWPNFNNHGSKNKG